MPVQSMAKAILELYSTSHKSVVVPRWEINPSEIRFGKQKMRVPHLVIVQTFVPQLNLIIRRKADRQELGDQARDDEGAPEL